MKLPSTSPHLSVQKDGEMEDMDRTGWRGIWGILEMWVK